MKIRDYMDRHPVQDLIFLCVLTALVFPLLTCLALVQSVYRAALDFWEYTNQEFTDEMGQYGYLRHEFKSKWAAAFPKKNK